MLRTTLTKPLAGLRPLRIASFATTSRAMGEGDTGAPPKTGGHGDMFQQREQASENYTVRKRQMERLQDIMKRLDEQRSHLDRLEEHIKDVTKDQGGEQN